jgi:hypothetical protein
VFDVGDFLFKTDDLTNRIILIESGMAYVFVPEDMNELVK